MYDFHVLMSMNLFTTLAPAPVRLKQSALEKQPSRPPLALEDQWGLDTRKSNSDNMFNPGTHYFHEKPTDLAL